MENNLKRQINPIFYNSNSDSAYGSENEIENENNFISEQEEYVNSIFPRENDKLLLNKMREGIVFIYIRAHSALPYNNNQNNINKKFNTYTAPQDMNIVKITAAFNGEPNYSSYEYLDKKQLIMKGIRKFYDTINTNNTKIIMNLIDAAISIRNKLKKFEIKNKIKDANKRNIVSANKTLLNKIIVPLDLKQQEEKNIVGLNNRGIPKYIPLQLFFLDKETNEFIALDIYKYVYEIYRKKEKLNYDTAILISDIIKFLYDYLKLYNVVLMDFSCSSYPIAIKEDKKIKLTKYINDRVYHGGNYKLKSKLKSNKNKKKTKQYKNKNNCKTKK
jgi:hypothetical protein